MELLSADIGDRRGPNEKDMQLLVEYDVAVTELNLLLPK
jgi:hypothetical protein